MKHCYAFLTFNKLRFYFIITLSPILFGATVFAQNSVGIGTTDPNPNAVLDIESNPNTPQGLLVPRLTSELRVVLGISLANDSNNNNNGLLVYDTTENTFYFWNGTVWEKIVPAGAATYTGGNGITITTGNQISTNLSGRNGITVTPQLSGEVTIEANADGDVSGPLNDIQLEAGVVTAAELADNEVTAIKLRSATDDNNNMDRSVTTNHIRNSAITTNKVAPGPPNASTYLNTNGNGVVGWTPFPITPVNGEIPIGNDAGGFNSIAVSGDINLSTANGTATVQGLQGKPIASSVANVTGNQVLVWNGQEWEPRYLYLDQSTQGYNPASTAGNRYYSFDATDFKQVSNLGTASVDFTNNAGEGIRIMSNSTTYLISSLHLPHNAEITQVKLFYYDNDASNDITFELYEKDLLNNSSTVKGSASSSGASGSNRNSSFTVSPPLTTDNENAAYTLRVGLAGLFQYIYGGIVYYKVTQPD